MKTTTHTGRITSVRSIVRTNSRLHVLGVAGNNLYEHAGDDFLISVQQMHLAAGDQRVVVVADVADGVALVLAAPVLPLGFLSVILRVGKCRDHPVTFAHGVPSAM